MGFFDWLFGKRQVRDHEQNLNEELAHWRIAEIMGENGDVVVARVRLRRPELPDLDRYTAAVSISWPFDESAAAVTEAMNQFEDSMEELAEFSYLIQVRTGLGERNWLYYTSDSDRLVAEIKARALAQGLRELLIEAQDDPDWTEWRVLAERIG